MKGPILHTRLARLFALVCALVPIVLTGQAAGSEASPDHLVTDPAGGLSTRRGSDEPEVRPVCPLPEFRSHLLEYASIFELEGMGDGLDQFAAARGYLVGRAGYELLVLDASLSPDREEGTGLRPMLERIHKTLGDTPAGDRLGAALAIRRQAASGEERMGPQATKRPEADRRLAALIFGGERGWSAERLSETRRLFEDLGDHEGLGSLLAAAAAAAPADGACALLDAAAEAFERTEDSWSAASARESCTLLGTGLEGNSGDLERLELAVQGYQQSGDRSSEARSRLSLARGFLAVEESEEALHQFQTAESFYASASEMDEAGRLCARGVADAVIQIAERAFDSGRASGLWDLLEAGAAAARRGRSIYHQAWISYEKARAWSVAGDSAAAEAEAQGALSRFRESTDDEGIVECSCLLGDWAAASGRHGEAAARYREAALASAALGEQDSQRALSVLRAEELGRSGQYELAGRLARKLLDAGGLVPKRRQTALSVLGDALLLADHGADAASVYAQALELTDAPGLAARRASALLRAGRPAEAVVALGPVIAAPGASRLEERLYLEALHRSGDSRAPLGAPTLGTGIPPRPAARGRLAGRLLAEGHRAEAIQEARQLAAGDDPLALFDAAAIAAGSGQVDLAKLWARRALGRGLEGILIALDPDLSRVPGIHDAVDPGQASHEEQP